MHVGVFVFVLVFAVVAGELCFRANFNFFPSMLPCRFEVVRALENATVDVSLWVLGSLPAHVSLCSHNLNANDFKTGQGGTGKDQDLGGGRPRGGGTRSRGGRSRDPAGGDPPRRVGVSRRRGGPAGRADGVSRFGEREWARHGREREREREIFCLEG